MDIPPATNLSSANSPHRLPLPWSMLNYIQRPSGACESNRHSIWSVPIWPASWIWKVCCTPFSELWKLPWKNRSPASTFGMKLTMFTPCSQYRFSPNKAFLSTGRNIRLISSIRHQPGRLTNICQQKLLKVL